jgi:hypothetical protein
METYPFDRKKLGRKKIQMPRDLPELEQRELWFLESEPRAFRASSSLTVSLTIGPFVSALAA